MNLLRASANKFKPAETPKRHRFTLRRHGSHYDILTDGVPVIVGLLWADVERNRKAIEKSGGTLE